MRAFIRFPVTDGASASYRDFHQREKACGAGNPGKEIVEHQQCDLWPFIMDVIFNNDLYAECHVIQRGDHEQRHGYGIDGLCKECDRGIAVRSDQPKSRADEPDGKRNECDGCDALTPEMPRSSMRRAETLH